MRSPTTNPYAGSSTLELLAEYVFWGGKELGHAALGCVWIGFVLAFGAFFYHYHDYYQKGVVQKDKSYYLSYVDLQKVVKRISGACAMFLVGSYCLTFADGFDMAVLKGAVMAAIVYPPIFFHYNDETRYRFQYTKGD